MLSDSSKKIETKLKLLGVTAIEDRLQDGVTECIDDLRIAGIQVTLTFTLLVILQPSKIV